MGEFGQLVLASIAPVQYPASHVFLFPVYQPYKRFLTVIDFTAVSASLNDTYGIGLLKLFMEHHIACGSDCNYFKKNLYITDLDKLSSKHSARLP